MTKKLSLKGLADFMTASPSRQRKILQDYKYPSEDEARAKILYYRDAKDRIVAFHRSSHNVDWLLQQAKDLDNLAGYSASARRVRLEHNARGIRQYARHFASREFEIIDGFSRDIQFADVFISVYPDLHVREGEVEKIIKLEFMKDTPDPRTIKILSQCMFEAAQTAGLDLPSSSVLYFDVPRGRSHSGARIGARMVADIEATCRNISAIWDSI